MINFDGGELRKEEWASLVVIIPKQDGDVLFCLYFRHANTMNKRDVYAISRTH